MKILKHICRVLSAHTGPFQGLNMITTDCQNCINNFHFQFFDTIVYKKIYKSMAASLSLVTLVPLANGWPPQPPSWQKCPQFGEKELGSALLDVPSTNCLLCLMLISHPSAEDCEDHDHVRGKLLMLFRTASATTMPSRPSSGGCHHTG